ncbi:MAG: 30S ribosomal protein S5 [Patescibacteria group bacterium]
MENTQPQPRDQKSFGNRPGGRGGRGGPGGGRPGGRDRGPARERVKPEFDQKIIDLRRVTRVVAGGKRFNFSVHIIAGDRKGRVGVGTGKAGDTASAIEKALRDAKKHMITVKTTKEGSIRHTIEYKYSSAQVFLRPARGRGLIAGSALRNVLELGGIKDVNGKILSSSKNKLNIARATIEALKMLS